MPRNQSNLEHFLQHFTDSFASALAFITTFAQKNGHATTGDVLSAAYANAWQEGAPPRWTANCPLQDLMPSITYCAKCIQDNPGIFNHHDWAILLPAHSIFAALKVLVTLALDLVRPKAGTGNPIPYSYPSSQFFYPF